MKIINGTKWATGDLRDMIGQALRDHGVPSKKLRVIVTYARSGIPSGQADPGRHKPKGSSASSPRFPRGLVGGVVVRGAGSYQVRSRTTIEYGKAVRFRIPNPPPDFDPESETHVELVIDAARVFDASAIILAAGTPSSSWREKPIAWLSDWFEVYRGEKGRAIGSRVSPLLPAIVKPKVIDYEKAIAYEKGMLKKTLTRIRRLETLAKKRARKIVNLERRRSQWSV